MRKDAVNGKQVLDSALVIVHAYITHISITIGSIRGSSTELSREHTRELWKC